jgi:hypothetical protein
MTFNDWVTLIFYLDLAAIVGMIAGTLIYDRPVRGRHRYNRRTR